MRNVPLIKAVALAAALTVSGCSGSDSKPKAGETTTTTIKKFNREYFMSSYLHSKYGIKVDQRDEDGRTALTQIACVDTDLVIGSYGIDVVFKDAVQCSDGDPQVSEVERTVLELKRQSLLSPPVAETAEGFGR